jgi:hypothetical protein
MQHDKKDRSTESHQHHLAKARELREALEKQMGYKPKGLSEQDQAQLDNEFRNSFRMRKWQG